LDPRSEGRFKLSRQALRQEKLVLADLADQGQHAVAEQALISSRHLLLQHYQTWSARGQIQTALNARCSGKAVFFGGKHFQQF
jgi:hypothetical protein